MSKACVMRIVMILYYNIGIIDNLILIFIYLGLSS